MEGVIESKAIDAVAVQISNVIDLVGKKAPGFLFDAYKNGEMVLNKGLPEYLAANFSKCETVRTLLKRDAPTLLADIYESPNFSSDGKTVPEEELIRRIGRELNKTIVSGIAGSGKSIFLKHLFRASIEKGMTFYPVFFELRNFPNDESANLIDTLFQSIGDFAESFTKKQFLFGLKRGLFFLMLDALDEAPPEQRDRIEHQIIEAARKYPHCPLVLTSRPSDSFSSWEGFHTAHLLPFTKQQCISFIGKIDFAADRKAEFLDALNGDLFEDHSDFLSNPLLASMMLLTFDEFGEIPQRRHVFYEKCFRVLLKEHDSSKGRYRRKFCSALEPEDVEHVFMMFCVFSYLADKFVFEEEEVVQFIEDACIASNVNAKSREILTDLVDAASVLQRDGVHFEFVHRSFQEYFYAKFVVVDRDHPLVEKILEIASRSASDDTIAMIADMNRSYFEKDFILPVCRDLLKKFRGQNPLEKPDVFLAPFFSMVRAREKRGSELKEGEEERIAIHYAVTHNEEEYPKRAVNLVLFDAFLHYGVLDIPDDDRKGLSDSDILKAFDVTELSMKRRGPSFPINYHSRRKMLYLGLTNYAVGIERAVRRLVEKIENSHETRRSKLAEKLRRSR
jgi:hypothetical protein